ncbi:MAG: methyltransferase domain-containing protein [Patescibacteria group bacterium]
MDKYNEDEMKEYLSKKLDFIKFLDFDQLSKYNHGHLRYKNNPLRDFTLSEFSTYNRIFSLYDKCKRGRVLEIGTFIPTIPLGLKKMGYKVVTVEKTEFYGDTYKPVIKCLEKNNIDFYDLDIIDKAEIKKLGSFDYINLIAVVEHLLGSPQELFKSIHSLLKKDGKFIFEVPNLASFKRRINFLISGTNPMGNYADYFLSEYPFEGHHRLMNYNEVLYLFKNTDFEILKFIPFNKKSNSKNSIVKILEISQKVFGDKYADSLLVIAQKK